MRRVLRDTLLLNSGFLALQQSAGQHDHHKHDEVEQHLDAVSIDAGEAHEQAAHDGQYGGHIAVEALQVLQVHQLQENGDVQQVQRDDGQLGRIEAEGAEPGLRSQVGAVEVHQPQTGDQQADDGGVGGHTGSGIDVLEHLQFVTVAVHSQVIHTAAHGHGQAVAGTPAGDDHEHKDQRTANLAEDILEGHLGAVLTVFHHDRAVQSAGQTDVVSHIHHHDDDGTDDQSAGQVALGILQLAADGGGADPTLIGEGQSHNAGEQTGSGGNGGVNDIGEVIGDLTVGQANDGADDRHQTQGDQLDGGGGNLELTGQLGGQGVHGIGRHHENHAQRHDRCAGGIAPHLAADQHAQIAGGQPAQHAGQRGIIHNRHKPAHIVGVGLAAGSAGKGHQAVSALIVAGHNAEGVGADNHHNAHDEPGQHADHQVAAGILQHHFRLEEHAGTDDGTDHHSDGRQQVITFFHKYSSSLSAEYISHQYSCG